jgi:hypothetical protein
MTPIELLTKELEDLKRCKEKSIKSYKRGSINLDLHITHLSNLNLIIRKYEKAIEILIKNNL